MEISVSELKQKLDAGLDGILIDVRMPQEHQAAAITEAQLIPLPTLAEHIGGLPNDQIIYVHCKMGGRSARACAQLRDAGFTKVVNIAGGIDAWRDEIDPSLPMA